MRHLRLLGLLLVALVAGCGAAPAATAVPPDLPPHVALGSRLLAAAGGIPREGEAAPDFSISRQDGTQLRLSDLRGRVVLVNFWATWCAPCKEEMPALQQLADEYGDRVAVLGINKLETLEAIGPFAREMPVRFTLAPNPAGDISDRYAAKNIPITYFIASDGTVGSVQLGVMTYEQARAQIEALE